MHVGVRTSPPTYHSLLFLWLVEFNRTLLHKHLGRLVVRYEPQHAYHLLLIFALGLSTARRRSTTCVTSINKLIFKSLAIEYLAEHKSKVLSQISLLSMHAKINIFIF